MHRGVDDDAVVRWDAAVERVLGGDLTAALAYLTPADGAVVTAVAPIGLRDRDRGEVTFTTSLGLGRKLDRIRRNPRVVQQRHAREHGFAADDRQLVLVQGRARIEEQPDQSYLDDVVAPAATPFLGPPRRGPFWDRWLREYYADRVPVHITVERIAVWPSLDGAGAPHVEGAAWPAADPAPQAPPGKGRGPRLDSVRAARRAAARRHVLLAWRGADGLPVVAPVRVEGTAAGGVALRSATPLPPGGRRAGLLAHDYGEQLVALRIHQHTGWLEVDDDDRTRGVYAPHTAHNVLGPANKTLVLLVNGLMAKQGLRRARRQAGAGAQVESRAGLP